MDVLLIKNVEKLGRRGVVVKVADGYARNYLLPRGFAVIATAKNRDSLASVVAREDKKLAAQREQAAAVAAQLTNVELTFEKLANENGELYGSLAPQEVTDALAARGFALDKKQIHFDEAAARLGVFTARVRLFEGVEAAVPVTIVRQES
jgi:large subunit ribosomal protein L9